MKRVPCQNPQYQLYEYITNCIGKLKTFKYIIYLYYRLVLVIDVKEEAITLEKC